MEIGEERDTDNWSVLDAEVRKWIQRADVHRSKRRAHHAEQQPQISLRASTATAAAAVELSLDPAPQARRASPAPRWILHPLFVWIGALHHRPETLGRPNELLRVRCAALDVMLFLTGAAGSARAGAPGASWGEGPDDLLPEGREEALLFLHLWQPEGNQEDYKKQSRRHRVTDAGKQ